MPTAPKPKAYETGERRLDLTAPPPGGRLDQVLAALVPGESRSRVQDWVRDGRVEVDGRPARKSGVRLSGGERIRVALPEPQPSGLQPEPIPLDILYEDQNLLVINKPAGMVVHPAPGHASRTLVNAVLAHAPDLSPIGDEIRPGIVHRLDRDTSGLIVVAKNERTLREVQAQFSQRTVEKHYLGLVDGRPPAREGRIEAAIGRDPRNRKRMSVQPDAKGRPAATHYKVRESFDRHALLDLLPETGRTHQLRLHLAFVGCPIVGDRVYGRRTPSLDVDRQMLHAWRLAFRVPGETDGPRLFEAPIPDDMTVALDSARGRVSE